jgi:hypothetical protein
MADQTNPLSPGVLSIIEQIAPTVATMLGGPAAGIAVQVLATAFGLPASSDPAAVAAHASSASADTLFSAIAQAEQSLVSLLPKPATPPAPVPSPSGGLLSGIVSIFTGMRADPTQGTTVSIFSAVVKLMILVLGAYLIGTGRVSTGVWDTLANNSVAVVGSLQALLAGASLLKTIAGSNANTVIATAAAKAA